MCCAAGSLLATDGKRFPSGGKESGDDRRSFGEEQLILVPTALSSCDGGFSQAHALLPSKNMVFPARSSYPLYFSYGRERYGRFAFSVSIRPKPFPLCVFGFETRSRLGIPDPHEFMHVPVPVRLPGRGLRALGSALNGVRVTRRFGRDLLRNRLRGLSLNGLWRSPVPFWSFHGGAESRRHACLCLGHLMLRLPWQGISARPEKRKRVRQRYGLIQNLGILHIGGG